MEGGESTLEKWAPLLVVDSRLAEIGACATRIHTLGSSALIALTYIWVDLNVVLPISEEKRVRTERRSLWSFGPTATPSSKFANSRANFVDRMTCAAWPCETRVVVEV